MSAHKWRVWPKEPTAGWAIWDIVAEQLTIDLNGIAIFETYLPGVGYHTVALADNYSIIQEIRNG